MIIPPGQKKQYLTVVKSLLFNQDNSIYEQRDRSQNSVRRFWWKTREKLFEDYWEPCLVAWDLRLIYVG